MKNVVYENTSGKHMTPKITAYFSFLLHISMREILCRLIFKNV